ncbi:MAG: acyl-CoA dehydrogenase family protein [Bacteroidota bacterium]|nr:acyl-CoA dehydrogenase family protein [Bacteroidota bacterium]
MTQSQLKALKSDIQSFLKKDILDLEKKVLYKGWNASIDDLEKKREKVKSLGYWTPQIPEKYGGMGMSLVEFAQISSILGSSPIGLYLFNCQAPDAGNMEILIEYGTNYQKDKFLKPLLAGEIRSCFSMTEPDFAGSNPIYMGTSAIKKDDKYILNGKKWYTSSAEGSSFAIVMAITNPKDKNKYLRASQIIVPCDSKGFSLVRKIPVMGDEGEGYFSHSEISYDNVEVSEKNLLGDEGYGFKIAQSRLGPGRIHHCMRWIGICERSFDMMCERAATRELSPGKYLGEKQLIQKMISERRVEISAAKLLVMDVANKIEKFGSKKSKVEISMIKFYCANVLKRVIDDAIQIYGGLGMSDDIILSHFYRHERAARIYDGADEVHISSVAKGILSTYGLKI